MAKQTIPTEDGWYWIWDDELTVANKWCVALLQNDRLSIVDCGYHLPTDTPGSAVADSAVLLWTYEHDGVSWVSVDGENEECRPTRWVKINKPEVPRDPS